MEWGAPGPREGAKSIIYGAVSLSLKLSRDNGAYLLPIGKISVASKDARDPKMAQNLWDWTEKKLSDLGY